MDLWKSGFIKSTDQPTTDYLPTDLPTYQPTNAVIMFKRLENSKIFILQNTNTAGKM